MSSFEKLLTCSYSFDWNIEFNFYPKKIYKRNMKFVLANVLGNSKGKIFLYSIYGNNTISHIIRDYYILTNACDNPHYKYVFHKEKDLYKLSTDYLNKLSFHKAKPSNVFSKIDFDTNCYGIN